MALLNGSFETAGTDPGEASDWVITPTSSGETYADFTEVQGGPSGTEPLRGQEQFEKGWGEPNLFAFVGYLIDITPAFFDGAANQEAEDFNNGWGFVPARVESTLAPLWDLNGSPTLTIKVAGGAEQTITFSPSYFYQPGSASAEEVRNAINDQLQDASAAIVAFSTIRLQSFSRGVSATLEVTGGSANAVLAFPTGVVTGIERNGAFIAVLGGSLLEFGPDNDPFEDFEDWSGTIDLVLDPGDTIRSLTSAAFDTVPQSFEDFEEDWGSFDDTPDPGDIIRPPTFATFTGPADFEDFEGTWTAMTTL